jgi:hypothetical protein
LPLFFILCAAAHAQVEPEATGPRKLSVPGNLHYALRYSQTAEFGATLDDWQTSSASGSLDYANDKAHLPFHLNYGGGYTWTIAGPAYSTGLFQRLLLSQAYVQRKWNLLVSDDVSYRPQAPTTGFSGIPGIGEPIGGSSPTPPSSELILTLNTHVVNNVVNGEYERSLSYGTTLSIGGGSELLRYPDGNGLNTNSQMANAGFIGRLNARNSLSCNYRFSQFSYPLYGFSFTTNAGLFGFKRSWNRKIATYVSAGPQWTGSSDATAIPSTTTVAADATINYRFRFVSTGLHYSRGVNGGGGYLPGGESDTVSANFSREFGKKLNVGIEGSYRRTAGLINNGVTNSKYGGVQASRRIGRYLSAYANYTAMDQSSSSALPANALSQLIHVVGFGIEYSPRETRLRR